MLTGKKIIIFGAGILGRRALNFFGQDRVYCFTDNYKAGQMFWGKPVISFDELKAVHHDYDVVISVGMASYVDLESQCKRAGVPYCHFHNMVSYKDYESNPEIARFKDIHKGKRCFLIGNGPSLTPDDLTTLHGRGEICFACNMISNIYDKTPWRPRYYIIADPAMLLKSNMLANIETEYKFFPEITDIYIRDKEDDIKALFDQKGGRILYYHLIFSAVATEKPLFSSDVSRGAYTANTVMYIMMQFAVYMGFAKIYLLGVDGTALSTKDVEQFLSNNLHFYEEDPDFICQVSAYCTLPDPSGEIIRTVNTYESAEAYTREHSIRIYNATRGGKLEVFERVDFDQLF